MAVCLLEKVVVLEKKRAKPARDGMPWWDEALEGLQRLGDTLTRLRAEDVKAYGILAGALKAEQEQTSRDDAAEAASHVPVAIMEAAADALRTATAVGRRCAKHLRADVAVATEFLGSAVQAAFWISRANALLMENPERRAQLLETLRHRRDEGAAILQAAREEFAENVEARRR